MHMKFTSLCISFFLLAGCQSGPHRFDGRTGYQTARMDDDQILVMYVDEATLSWEALDQKTAQLCPRLFKKPAQSVQGKTLARAEFDQTLANPIPDDLRHLGAMPTYNLSSGRSPAMGGASPIPQVPVHFPMKKMLVLCEIRHASAQALP